MSEWVLAGKTFTTSELQTSIRLRDSEGSNALVKHLLAEKAENSPNSIALTVIDTLKKSHKFSQKKNPNFSHVPDSLFEESYNDALLAIYVRIEKFDSGKASLNTWIDKIFYWTFLTNYRKWQADKQNISNPSIDDEEKNPLLGLPETTGGDMEESIWQDDILVTAYKNLSDRDRILLHYNQVGLTPTQMVEEGYLTGVSVNAVRVNLFEARKRFKKELSRAGWKI